MLERELLPAFQDQCWQFRVINDLRNPLIVLQFKVTVREAMSRFLLRGDHTAVLRHGREFLLQPSLQNRDCGRNWLNEWIEKGIGAVNSHDLIEQFQGRKKHA